MEKTNLTVAGGQQRGIGWVTVRERSTALSPGHPSRLLGWTAGPGTAGLLDCWLGGVRWSADWLD